MVFRLWGCPGAPKIVLKRYFDKDAEAPERNCSKGLLEMHAEGPPNAKKCIKLPKIDRESNDNRAENNRKIRLGDSKMLEDFAKDQA